MINENFLLLQNNYLFFEIDKRVKEFEQNYPHKSLINLGIGDISFPLPKTVVQALCSATKEMENKTIGYGPAQGYLFLREAICQHDYKSIGFSSDEVFISDGAKNDSANLLDLFSKNIKIAMSDPVYPVYLDSSIISGKSHKSIHFLPCLETNNFFPSLPSFPVNIIYLCSPNNPTGIALTKEELKKWVDYALSNHSVIIYDGTYEKFINDKTIPRSIYEIPNAKKVAIEIRSYSKSAGFTGLRCSYTVIPHELTFLLHKGKEISLNTLWKRRVEAKFGGVAYPIQKAALATHSHEGQRQIKTLIDTYKKNIYCLRTALAELGYTTYGGINSPYLWWKIPNNISSWNFFSHLLEKAQIISIPGVGFGQSGEGFVRLSAFNTPQMITKALKHLSTLKESILVY